MERIGGKCWSPAALAAEDASMVSELSIVAARGDFHGGDYTP